MLSCLLVVTQAVAPAPPPAPPPAPATPHKAYNSRKIVPVDDTTTVIEEKSVGADPGLSAAQSAGSTDRFQVLEGGSTTLNRSYASLNDMQEDVPNGATYYVFTLQAGERLKVDMKGEQDGKTWMQFVKKPLKDAMESQLYNANRPFKSTRCRVIHITNILKEPYQVLLAVYGFQNYAYKLAITRSK